MSTAWKDSIGFKRHTLLMYVVWFFINIHIGPDRFVVRNVFLSVFLVDLIVTIDPPKRHWEIHRGRQRGPVQHPYRGQTTETARGQQFVVRVLPHKIQLINIHNYIPLKHQQVQKRGPISLVNECLQHPCGLLVVTALALACRWVFWFAYGKRM